MTPQQQDMPSSQHGIQSCNVHVQTCMHIAPRLPDFEILRPVQSNTSHSHTLCGHHMTSLDCACFSGRGVAQRRPFSCHGRASATAANPIQRQRNGRGQRHRRHAAGSESTIENLPDICNDFQCDSSPQVEQSIRSFAKNIERHSTWTIGLFAGDVECRVRSHVNRTTQAHIRVCYAKPPGRWVYTHLWHWHTLPNSKPSRSAAS